MLQAYLRESPAQLDRLIDWAGASSRTPPLTVRLVKGAYWDHEVVEARQHGWAPPVFEVKAESDRNFEELTRRLLDARPLFRVAIASHNLRSVAHAIAWNRATGGEDRDLELQILRGLGDELQQALAAGGHRVRAYCPVGDLVAGMAYLVRRLLENTVERLVPGRAAAGHADRRAAGRAVKPSFANEPRARAAARRPCASRSRRRWPSWTRGCRSARAGPARRRPGADGASSPPTRAIPARVVATAGRAGEDDAARGGARPPQAASAEWGAVPAAGARRGARRGAAAALRERRLELAALMVRECAKPWAEADADACEAIDFLEYYARAAVELDAGAALLQVPGERNAMRYAPRGVVAVIAPWNFPLAIATGHDGRRRWRPATRWCSSPPSSPRPAR